MGSLIRPIRRISPNARIRSQLPATPQTLDKIYRFTMPHFRESLLAIEFTPTGVTLAECAKDRVLKSATLGLPSSLNAQPEQAGHWLAQQLNAARISTKKTVIVIARQHAPLKLLDVPLVADDELAALVQLQAESRLSKPLDEFHVDFVAQAPVSGEATRRVLLATVLKSALEPLLNITQAAGLHVVGATVGEVGVPLLALNGRGAATSATDGQQRLIEVAAIVAGDQSVLIASQHGRALGSLPLRLRGDQSGTVDDARLLASSMSRLLATIGTDHSAANLSAFTLCGAASPSFVAAVQAQLSVRVSRCGETVPGSLLRLLAATQAIAQRDAAINFITPRRPTDQAAIKRRYYARLGSAAAVLFALTGWTYWDESRALDGEIAAKKKELAQLNQLIERGQPIVETSAFIAEWQHSRHDWAKELERLNQHLPARERLHLNRLTFEAKSQTGTAVVRASGAAREPRDVTELTEKLVESEQYALQPKSITPNSRDPLYRANFEVEAVRVEAK